MTELRALWAHQQREADRALEDGRTHYGLLMEQGTGKTGAMIDILRRLYTRHGRPLKTLIICPQIVIKNWEEEFGYFSNCQKYVQTLTGTTPRRIAQIQTPGKHIFVTNFEALHSCKDLLWTTKTRGKEEIRVPVPHGWEVIIVDESHRISSPSAQSTKMAWKLGDKAHYRYILSGTPVLDGVGGDIFAQFRFLDLGTTFGTYIGAFKREWMVDMNAGMPSVRYFPDWKLKPGGDVQLNELIYRKAGRVEKKDCLTLPPLVMKQIKIELSSEQRRHYDEMKHALITYLSEDACVAQTAMTKALRLLQITSGFMKLEDDEGTIVSFKGNPRAAALADILADARGVKTIVWAVFKENYRAIADVCTKLGRKATFLTGEQTHDEKVRAVTDFCTGDHDTLIANPGAGGTGVNLVEAPLAVWYSRNHRLEHRLQALARNHRGGSDMHDKVTNIDIVAESTLDEHVLSCLDRKEDVAQAILSWRAQLLRE